MNLGTGEGAWPPKLVAVLSERWWPHVVREGFNTAAYYLNVSAFADLAVPSMLRFAIDKGWRFSEGLRDQGLLNDFFRAYSNSPGPHRYTPLALMGCKILIRLNAGLTSSSPLLLFTEPPFRNELLDKKLRPIELHP